MTAKGCGRYQGMIIGLIFLAMGIGSAVAAEKIPRMAKEELKEMLGKPDVIILDVRSSSDWKKSDSKIRGAIREQPDQATNSWAEKYSKDKTIVLYCA